MPRLQNDLWIIYVSLLLFALAMGLYSVIMPAYIRELGATSVQLGLLGSVALAIGTLSAIPGGLWADRFERRKLMLVGWAMCIPVPLIYAFSQHWLWLIPGYFLFNFSMFSNAAMQAYIASKTDENNRSFTFTFVMSSFSMGFVFAPTLGGYLAQSVGIRGTFWFSLVLYTLSTLSLLFLSPSYPEKHESRPAGVNWRDYPKQFWVLVALFSVVWFVMNIPASFNTPYLQDIAHLDLLKIGFLGSIAAIGGAILSPFLGKAADKFGSVRVLGICLCVTAGTYIIQLYAPTVYVLALVFLIRGGFSAVMSLMTAVISGISDRRAIGMSFAMYNLATGSAATLAPYTAGWLYGQNARFPFVLTIVLALIAGVYFVAKQQKRGEEQCHSPTF
ncbi:MAG: major facilitator superfamily protein [Bacillota bacterium]|nr:MAG: major facilitator superfamily protein [Bacillota bacterium]MBS3949858.1 MFS transporter [Peptococcaceae bacterium]